MEDHKNEFIAILAGYEREMEAFLKSNPGLPSRFPIHIHFPDYNADSLLKIARRTAEGRQYRLSGDAEITLRRKIRLALQDKELEREPFSNARFVRNLIERAVRKQALRLFDDVRPKRDELLTLQATDFMEGADR